MEWVVLQLPQERFAPRPRWQVGCQRSVMMLVPCSLTDHHPRVVKLPLSALALIQPRALSQQASLTSLRVVAPLVLKTRVILPLTQLQLDVRPHWPGSAQCRFHPCLVLFCHFLP